jgi:hypothetical protein
MLNITVDDREFQKVFKEYMTYSKRSFAEACNQHAYYIARDAVLVTKGADKNVIKAKLEGPSTAYPDVPLAAILVNVERAKKGKKGLNGQKMVNAVEKLIRKYQSHVNFVRAGWIPAIKKLAAIVPKKGGEKIPSGTAKTGRNFGGATPAKDSGFSPIAWIWNSVVGGKQYSSKVHAIIEEGAQKAVKMETISMRNYIIKKQEEARKKFWKFS